MVSSLLRTIALVGVVALAGCSWLPASGPLTADILDHYQDKEKPSPAGVKLVEMNTELVAASNAVVQPNHALVAANKAVPPDTISIGDVLSISIYQVGGNAFTPAPENLGNQPSSVLASNAGLPPIVVDRNGTIAVPFAGRMHVVGKTPTELERMIAARLDQKLVQPQVIVNILASQHNVVTVLGDVKKVGRFPLAPGERLLDSIAMADGLLHPEIDEAVVLTRGAQEFESTMVGIEHDPASNVLLQPLDRVRVAFNPRSFTVMGATGRIQEIPFDREQIRLNEAIARTGGPADAQADIAGIFLFRFESPQVVAPDDPKTTAVPVIYHMDMSNPDTFFMLKQLSVRDKDLIYIADARAVQLQKLFTLVGSLFAPASSVGSVSTSYTSGGVP